jgi:taste receptor type 2
MFYWHYYRSHAMLVWFAPLFLFFLAIVLLMFSLYWHVAHMKNHRLGPRDPSTQAHTRALKSLVLFFIFYTWYSLCLIIHTIKIPTIQDAWHWAKEVITYAGICLHSTILMLSSPKLRKALKMRVSSLCSANS